MLIAYAPRHARPAIEALVTIDRTLADIVRSTTEPLIGQMRLTWWHDALTALDAAPPRGAPLLEALYAHVVQRGVSGADLAAMIDAWDILIDESRIDDSGLLRFADVRGGALFSALASILNADIDGRVAAAGHAWALYDLAVHVSDRTTAERAIFSARNVMSSHHRQRWARELRPIAAMVCLARARIEAWPMRTVQPPKVALIGAYRLWLFGI